MPPATHPARVEINRQIVDVFVHGPILPPSRARPFPGGCKCPVPGMPPANALPHANTELTAIKHLPHRTPSNSSGIYARTGRSAAPIAIIFPAPVSPDSDMQCQARDRCANAPDFLPARRKYTRVHIYRVLTALSVPSSLINVVSHFQLSVRTAGSAPSIARLFIAHLNLTTSVQTVEDTTHLADRQPKPRHIHTKRLRTHNIFGPTHLRSSQCDDQVTTSKRLPNARLQFP